MPDTSLNAGAQDGVLPNPGATRKITVQVPEELLARAREARGGNPTEVVRRGLTLVAAELADIPRL